MKPFGILVFLVVLRKLLCVRNGDDGAALLIDDSSLRPPENELFLDAIDVSIPPAASPKSAVCTHMRVANVMLTVDNTMVDGAMVAVLREVECIRTFVYFCPASKRMLTRMELDVISSVADTGARRNYYILRGSMEKLNCTTSSHLYDSNSQ